MAGLVFALGLALYVATLAPTTQFWDTSEYIAAAKVLGIPHPPGNPFFVLLAHVWGLLPLAGRYALRINLFAAVTSAAGAACLFLVAERFLRDIIPSPNWARRAAAFAGAVVGATSFTVWNQSVVNEKVYTVSLFSIALILWLTVRRADEPMGPRRTRWLILIAYLLALTATNHLMGLLVIPAVLVYVLWDEPAVLLRWRVWLAVFLVAALGVSVWVFLPIRAAQFPPINEGEPTTWHALWAVLNREQYQKPPIFDRQADLIWQYINYFQYFTWQFAHDWGSGVRSGLTALFGGLGLLGALRHWQRDRRGATAMIALMLTVTLLLVFYLNFKYGFSIRPGENLPREVRERDYFFIASFQLWGVWVALGFGTVLELGAEFFATRLNATTRWYPAAPVLVLALIPLWGNHLTASRSHETLPRDFAVDLLQSVEPYGILVTTGDNDTFPLWYAQEVEGVRRDVLIANLSLANTLWHVRQLKRRETFPFDSTEAIAPYRGHPWPKPTDSPLDLGFEEIDQLPPFLQLTEQRTFQAGSLEVVLRPRILERADLVVLRLIRDNLGKRPIYFSRTTGGYADALGFTPYLVGQGLVQKLLPDTVIIDDGIVAMRPPLGVVDLPRTETLLFDLYHLDAVSRNRPRGWVDTPSEGILSLYALLYAGYADYVMTRTTDSTATPPDSAQLALAAHASVMANQIFAQTSFFQ